MWHYRGNYLALARKVWPASKPKEIMILGLSGYARSGKDAAAQFLVQEYGFKKISFADKLRDFLYQLNPIVAHSDAMGTWDVQTVIDTYGWGGYKETDFGPEIRRLLQRLGTDAARNILGENVWVHAALGHKITDENIVVTDCRFPNEAREIKNRGGEVWRINRAGILAVNNHISEIALDDWKFDDIIFNGNDLGDLHHNVKRCYLSSLQRKELDVF